MQDLEKLKLDIFESSHNGAIQIVLELITRCENAEKDRDEFKELLDMHRMSKDAAWCKVTGELLNIEDFKELVFKINSEKLALESELKELREQKPVAEDLLKRAFSLGEQAGIYGESDQPGLYNRAKKYEEDFKKLLDSVAQSRDSAEQNAIGMPDGWNIEKNKKPIPDRNHGYDFWHDNYDGADGGNGLCGTASGVEDAIKQIREISLCDWCLNRASDLILIEGFTFCCDNCELNYYRDRSVRRKSGKQPLFMERNAAKKSTQDEVKE